MRVNALLSVHLEVQPELVPLKGSPCDGRGFAKAANTCLVKMAMSLLMLVVATVTKVAEDVAGTGRSACSASQ